LAVRIAAIADLHACRRNPEQVAARLADLDSRADVLVCAGDLTDTGDPHEARAVTAALRGLTLPVVVVLGNHDFDGNHALELRAIFESAHWAVLDGEAIRLGDLGIAGAKGFGGGFGRRRVVGFGEPAIKSFVEEAATEVRRLENAARRLTTSSRVIVSHYAPVVGTVTGESPEIYPFLGNSELGAVSEAVSADVHVHGHAHFGRPEGRTPSGVAVYNVALPLLDSLRPPLAYRLIELPGKTGPLEPLSS
jgi:Icc-related predicted phosphoesterase